MTRFGLLLAVVLVLAGCQTLGDGTYAPADDTYTEIWLTALAIALALAVSAGSRNGN